MKRASSVVNDVIMSVVYTCIYIYIYYKCMSMWSQWDHVQRANVTDSLKLNVMTSSFDVQT